MPCHTNDKWEIVWPSWSREGVGSGPERRQQSSHISRGIGGFATVFLLTPFFPPEAASENRLSAPESSEFALASHEHRAQGAGLLASRPKKSGPTYRGHRVSRAMTQCLEIQGACSRSDAGTFEDLSCLESGGTAIFRSPEE
ncbi:hypothetical protein F1880_002311 [Penicillium rolfsii]|nr:hypothetical protein F1880_002311 [Penicillium rolfsii]